MRNKDNESNHFDKMVSGGSNKVLFYDTEFVSELTNDIVDFAIKKMGDISKSKILFYGSGVNIGPAVRFMNAGACVTLIDISPKSIEKLNSIITEKGYNEEMRALVMDCEHLEFEDHSFDFVFGRAILHHLDYKKSLNEIKRILKGHGKCVLIEPLGMNPFINLFRYLTPSRRTPDETPFSNKDIAQFEQIGFTKFEHHEFSFVTNIGIFFETVLKWKAFSYKRLKNIDDILLKKIPFLKRFCWNTVLFFEK